MKEVEEAAEHEERRHNNNKLPEIRTELPALDDRHARRSQQRYTNQHKELCVYRVCQ